MRGSLWNRRTVQRLRQALISTVGSMKIKLLLCCCIGFTLIALASRASDFMGWTNHTAALERFSDSRKGYSIVMNTWKRYDLLKHQFLTILDAPGLIRYILCGVNQVLLQIL
ncbi:glycosyltransferase family 64 protein C4 [Prunus yedoensis var. nudiflora]|uniref:Glycosyltransferase family 64 protein C4 n=1 Tax=Prunus yedoensis var. nudiflora TaxID=2094558 RepID=A0A314XRV1_PRUYE|nr:glycosyltransferase family 64 protein C4 [Prunus yedoensis var. nudiflora]